MISTIFYTRIGIMSIVLNQILLLPTDNYLTFISTISQPIIFVKIDFITFLLIKHSNK